MKKIAIVIPVYKTSFSENDLISLRHLNHYLGKYDRYFMIPDNFPKEKFRINGSKVVCFPNRYFTGVSKYSELVSLKEFYLKFIDYEYILIYQLDALVFSNQLEQWCNKGYDYVGAPWFKSIIGQFSHSKTHPNYGCNGGLSLRKVKSFIQVIDKVSSRAKRTSDNKWIKKSWFIKALLSGQSHNQWLQASPGQYPFNEDGFWSLEAVKYLPSFKVAPFSEALKFAFEVNPRRCFELNENILPFGCHAWVKYNKEFWLPYILNND